MVWLVGEGEGRCFEKFFILLPARIIPPRATLLGREKRKADATPRRKGLE